MKVEPEPTTSVAGYADTREAVLTELVECYGEGEDTDWPYLCDLADLIVSMIDRRLGHVTSDLPIIRNPLYFDGSDHG